MGKYFSVLIFDTATVSGTVCIVPQTDSILTGGARLYLIDAPNTTYTLAHLGKGVWGVDGVLDGVYKLQTNAGSWVDNIYFSNASGKWIGDESFDASIIGSGTLALARIPTITNTKLDTGIDAVKLADGSVSNTEFQYLNGVTSAIQTQFSTMDSLVVHKAGVETITGAKLFNAGANIVVDSTTTTAGYQQATTVTDNKHWVTLGHMVTYVGTQITNYIAGNIPAFQLADTYRRVIYNGTQETNRTFITINAAVLNAIANSPSVTNQFFIEIQKDSNSRVTANTISSVETVDYVHLFASNNRIRIFGADDAFDGGAGKTQITNLTIVWEAGLTATPSFTGCVFEDVIFDITDNAIDFTSCEFRGNCQVKRTTGTWTITTCTGSDITAEVLPTFTGANPYVRVNNQYNYRNLGTIPSIASGATITLTYGNSFYITGTTNISDITNTGWTDGSIVHLLFAGVLDVVNGLTIRLEGATNFTTAGGSTISFMLRSGVWYQIGGSIN